MSSFLQPSNPTEISWLQHIALKLDMSSDRFFCTSRVVVYLGLCARAPQGQLKHWAMIVEYGRPTSMDEPEELVEHVCAEHHVDERSRRTHPLIIYNSDRRSQYRGPFSPKTRTTLELSFQSYPLGLRRCYKVCIGFNSVEYSSGSGPGDVVISEGRPVLEHGSPFENQD